MLFFLEILKNIMYIAIHLYFKIDIIILLFSFHQEILLLNIIFVCSFLYFLYFKDCVCVFMF